MRSSENGHWRAFLWGHTVSCRLLTPAHQFKYLFLLWNTRHGEKSLFSSSMPDLWQSRLKALTFREWSNLHFSRRTCLIICLFHLISLQLWIDLVTLFNFYSVIPSVFYMLVCEVHTLYFCFTFFPVPEIIDGNTLTTTVVDLNAWVEYEFRVLAKNSVGVGEPSPVSVKTRTEDAGTVNSIHHFPLKSHILINKKIS